MRNLLFLIGSILLAGSFSLPAHAQWSQYDEGDTVRCESRDGRVTRCAVYNRGDIRLIRQLSSSPCIRDRSWGEDEYGIWVGSGCRAEFRVSSGGYYSDGYGYGDDRYGYGNGYGYGDNYGSFRCESRDRRISRCDTRGRRAYMVRQLSDMPCIRGRSWGTDYRGVWVSEGCRALFRVDTYSNDWRDRDWNNNGWWGGNNGYGHGQYRNDLVRCESRDKRSHSCRIYTGRNTEVRLLRQLSDMPCVEGQTWGRTASGVWVTGGCRAEFVVNRVRGRSPGDIGNVLPPGVLSPGDLGNGQSPGMDPSVNIRPRVEPREDRVIAREGAPSLIRPRPSIDTPEPPGRTVAIPRDPSPPMRPVRINDNAPGGQAGVFVPVPTPAPEPRAEPRREPQPEPRPEPAPRQAPSREEGEQQTP